jgi:hypothetical protein
MGGRLAARRDRRLFWRVQRPNKCILSRDVRDTRQMCASLPDNEQTVQPRIDVRRGTALASSPQAQVGWIGSRPHYASHAAILILKVKADPLKTILARIEPSARSRRPGAGFHLMAIVRAQ